MLDMSDRIFLAFMSAAAVFVAVCTVGLVLTIKSQFFSETYSLRKDLWVCSKTHDKVSWRTMSAGKAVIPYQSSTTVCDEWSRK